MGVAAESRTGWTIAGITASIAGFWWTGGGLRDAELHGFTGFVANADVNIVFGLAIPAVGARVFSRYPGHRLARLYCLCGLPPSIKLASFSCAQHGPVDRPPSLPGGFVPPRIWLCGSSPLLTFGVLWFSDGRMPSHRWWPVAAARMVVVSAMNFDAKVFMADFDGSNTPTFGNLLTGQLNQRKALLREIDFSTPERRELAGPGTTLSPITRTTAPAR